MDYDLELDPRADLQIAEDSFKKIQHLLAEIFATKSELPFAEVQWTRESWALASRISRCEHLVYLASYEQQRSFDPW